MSKGDKSVGKRSSEQSEEEILHSGQAVEYCFPMSIVVKLDAEKRSQKSYYNTKDKHAMLCILKNNSDWKEGNENDKKALEEFFRDTLKFQVNESEAYSKLQEGLTGFKNLDQVYCLVIFISENDNEEGINTDIGWKTNYDITRDFSEEKIKRLAGIPKIFILASRRGQTAPVNKREEKSSTTINADDCLVIHITHGNIDPNGSVGLKAVMKALKVNWEKDHLEEILIDARKEVAALNTEMEQSNKQTLEIQTTLLQRLKFKKC